MIQQSVALISQGASSTNLSFVVAERDVEEVVKQLRERFFGARAAAGIAAPVA